MVLRGYSCALCTLSLWWYQGMNCAGGHRSAVCSGLSADTKSDLVGIGQSDGMAQQFSCPVRQASGHWYVASKNLLIYDRNPHTWKDNFSIVTGPRAATLAAPNAVNSPEKDIYCVIEYKCPNSCITVRCCCKDVNFFTNFHKRYLMALPLAQGMGCHLWTQHSASIPALIYAISYYIGLRYNGTWLYL